MVFGGSWPERAIPGSRSATTEEFPGEQVTPAHEQGVALERFQKRTRPPTAERRASRAALSEAMSGAAEGRNRTATVTRRRWWKLKRPIFKNVAIESPPILCYEFWWRFLGGLWGSQLSFMLSLLFFSPEYYSGFFMSRERERATDCNRCRERGGSVLGLGVLVLNPIGNSTIPCCPSWGHLPCIYLLYYYFQLYYFVSFSPIIIKMEIKRNFIRKRIN